MSVELNRLLDKAVSGERLSSEEGLRILESHDLVAIGAAADAVVLIMAAVAAHLLMRGHWLYSVLHLLVRS